MNGWQFTDELKSHLREDGGTSHYDIIFRAECGDFVPLEILPDHNMQQTVVLLLEAGK